MPCSPGQGTKLRKDGAQMRQIHAGVLEATRVYLRTHQKSSEQFKIVGKRHTHLVEVQNLMQRSKRGSGTSRTHLAHEIMCRVFETMQQRLQKCPETSIDPQTS